MAERTPEQDFAERIVRTARKQFEASLQTEAGKQAAQNISMAFLSAMRSSRKPMEFLKCTPGSLAVCVSTSISTGLHPGGPNPVVYLVPQAPRKGEPPELQWRITHRGLAILAARAGFAILPVPVGNDDHLRVAYGEVSEHRADPAAWPEKLKEIAGVIVVVRRIVDGCIIVRAWVPRTLIERRRKVARTKSVWDQWPIEMSQKTAIKWAFSRGLVPLDSPELRQALEADTQEGQPLTVIDADVDDDLAAGPTTARELLLDEKIRDEDLETAEPEKVPVEPAQADEDEGTGMPG